MKFNSFTRALSALLVLIMLFSAVPGEVMAVWAEAEQEETTAPAEVAQLVTVDQPASEMETTAPMPEVEYTPPEPKVPAAEPAQKSPATKATATSGTTGSCTWTLDGTKLTISGTGPMADYTGNIPWGSEITEVVIADGVTTIGQYAFYYCSALKSVIIGNSVQTIGHHAFTNCSGLTSVTVGDSVKTIGAYAFDSCDSLTSVTLGDNITTVYERVFSFCDNLTTVDLGDSITSIPDYFFYKCPKLQSVTWGDSVTSIGKEAFAYCDSLLDIDTGDGVTTIGNNAFYQCTSLTSVVLGNKVTAVSDYVFYGCSSLKYVTVGSSVTSIGTCAFALCTSLISIDLGDHITSVGESAFFRCFALTSITLGDQVKTLGMGAFYECTSLISASLGDGIYAIYDETFYGCSALQTVTFGKYLSYIGSKVFCQCDSLSTIELPNSVSSIGDRAFYGCDSLTAVTIPYGIQLLPEFIFSDCKALETVVIPASVTSVGYYPFNNDTALKTVYYGGSSTQWEDGTKSVITGLSDSTELICLSDFTVFYKTETDHIFPVTYENKLPVEPGSSFNAVDLSIPGLKAQVTSGPAAVAKDGKTVEVDFGSSGTITVDIYYFKTKIISHTYTVADETNGLFACGYGTQERPFLIENASQFKNIGEVSSYYPYYYQLIDNIYLGSGFSIEDFCGYLDGCGYTLSGWSATQTIGNGDMGLFNTVAEGASISNLKIADFSIKNSNPNVSGVLSVGLLCGTNYGTISDIKMTQSSMNVDVGDIGKGADSAINAGMLCGDNYGSIIRCEVYGTSSVKNSITAVASADKSHTAQVFAGGLVGYSYGGIIQDCQAYYTDISARATTKGSTFIGLWCTGHGTSKVRIGGIVGHLYNTALTRVLGYSNNNLSGTSNHDGCGCAGEGYSGSVVGYSDNISLTDVFAQNNTSLNLVGNTTNYNGNKVAFGGYSNLLKLATYIDNGWVAVGSGTFSLADVDYIEMYLKKTQYEQGQPLDLNGAYITAYMDKASDGLSAEIRSGANYAQKVIVTGGYTVSGYDPDTLGYQTVTFSYGSWTCKKTVLVSSHDHTWITEATCARGQECGTCGYISADTLEHTYEAIVTSPTCEKGGYTGYTCSDCGHYYEDTAVPALGHDLDFMGRCLRCGEQFEMLRDFTVFVCDAETGKPIPDATVTMGGIKVLTGADGGAKYQLSNDDERKLVIEAGGYPKYENEKFIPGELPDTYIYLESKDTCIYEAWCNGDNVLLIESQINNRAPGKKAKIVVKGRAQTPITKYEIVQDGKVLAKSSNGEFIILNPHFLLDVPVYARMHTKGVNGDMMFERELKINVVGVSFDAKLDELIPHLGGATFKFDETAPGFFQGVEFPLLKELIPKNHTFKIKTDNEKLIITYGLEKDFLDKDTEDKSARELFKEILKNFDEQNNPNFWPKGKKKSEFSFTIALIVEFGEGGKIKNTYGEIYIGYEFTHKWGKTFVVWVVPIYVGTEFKVGGNLTISELGYNFEESRWLIPDAEIDLYAELSVYGGIGCSLISAGVYGTAGGEIVIGWKDLQNYFKYRIYGEVGIYARIDPIFWETIEYKLPLLAGEFYGPNGQIKTKNAILTSENYQEAPRDYLENRSPWKTPSTYAKRGDTSGVLQTSSYTAIEPRIVQSGDTVMMLFLDDDGSEGYNYQHLYYSILNTTTNAWGTPVRVDDSNCADLEYDVYADETGIYLAYSKIPEITGENSGNHLQLLSGVEIYTARYNGTSFAEHTNVSRNDCYDIQPQITKDAVAWISNNTNDTLGQNANNTLMLAQKATGWNAVVLSENGETVTSMDMGVMDGKNYVALIRDADCDLTTDDRRLQLIDTEGNAVYVETADYTSEGVRFEKTDGKDTLLWACAGNVWQLTSATAAPAALLSESNSAINDGFKYQQLGDDGAVILYTRNAMDGKKVGSSLYGVYFADGRWGQEVAITDHAEGMYVDAFDACYYKEKLLFAYINTETEIEDDSIHRTCSFVSSSVELKNDLAAQEAVYLESDLFEGAELEIVVPITNNSRQNLENVTVQVQSGSGTVILQQAVKLEETIASGGSGRAVFTLPKTLLTAQAQYTVTVNSTDWTDSDPDNNTVALELWFADFEVTAKQTIHGTTPQIQCAVTNLGNAAGSGKLVVYDDKNEDGSFANQPKLYEQAVTVEIGKSITAMVPVTDQFKDETVYVVIEPATPEKYPFNNEEAVSVGGLTSTETKDISGQEQAIPSPVFAEPYVIYDRYAGGDITAPVTENGWIFAGVQGLDSSSYSCAEGSFKLLSSYLQSLELGYHYYSLNYTMGDKTVEAMLIVEVRDHAPLSVQNIVVPYDGAPLELKDLKYETPSSGAISLSYSTDGENWIDGLPTNAGAYTGQLSLAAEEEGFYTAAQKQFKIIISKASRSISAPQDIRLTNDGITFTGAVPEKEPADGKITYGYSTKCDPNEVTQWTAEGAIPITSSDITYYLFAKITGSSNYQDAYSAAYVTDGMDFIPVAAVYEGTVEKQLYNDAGKAIAECSAKGYVKLLGHAHVDISLKRDLYVDLAGYDLSGCIMTNGYKIYGIDSTTDKYTCDDRGIFSCVDTTGTRIKPQTHFKSSITGAVKRYMAISEENGYSFHRFYLGVTHKSIKPSVTSVGFKAAFYADEMVIAALDSARAYGYSLTLSGYNSASAYKSRDSFVSGRTVTLRIDNYDVEHFGETVLSAKVMLRLSDGTVIESSSVTMTLRQLLEDLNANPGQMTEDQLRVVARMIEKYDVLKSWNLTNLTK